MARDSKNKKEKKKSQAEINRENLQIGISIINQHPLFGYCYCYLKNDGKTIGKALGSIASYSVAHDVPFARVVFCDASAYDAGYISPEDIAGRVAVKGRGGTALQPAINLLESAKDFPKDGPILIITDGEIEDHLDIKYEHAYLLPKGSHLPFHAKGQVFYFDN